MFVSTQALDNAGIEAVIDGDGLHINGTTPAPEEVHKAKEIAAARLDAEVQSLDDMIPTTDVEVAQAAPAQA